MAATFNKEYNLNSKTLKPFIETLKSLDEILEKLKVPVYPSASMTYENFLIYSSEQQLASLEKLNFYKEICRYALENSFKAKDLKLTWYALSLLGLRPPSSLFELLSEGDCIEIYNTEGIQIYRNFNFFDVCSYSPEDLLTHPWQELYERSLNIMGDMNKAAGKALTATDIPFAVNIPEHTILEKSSSRKRTCKVAFKYVSPLFDPNGNRTAFLATSSIHVLAEKPRGLNPEEIQLST